MNLQLQRKKKHRAPPGFEPGTSCTQSRNHTPRPRGLVTIGYQDEYTCRGLLTGLCDVTRIMEKYFSILTFDTRKKFVLQMRIRDRTGMRNNIIAMICEDKLCSLQCDKIMKKKTQERQISVRFDIRSSIDSQKIGHSDLPQ